MGMFDTVRFKCPNCGEFVEYQSKAGRCMLNLYDEDAVPPEIARDLHGDIDDCYHCGQEMVLKVQHPIQSVVMQAIKSEDWEENFD